MHRFYYPDVHWETIFILENTEIFHQITKVFRSKEGDEYIFFNGKEYVDYLYEIKEIEKKSIVFTLKEKISKLSHEESVHLFQALPNKTQKIEYIIQKWVEVGIDSFVFFCADRSQKLNLSENKLERYVKIAVEALEQSNGNIVPHIEIIKNLPKKMNWEVLFFHTKEEKIEANFLSQLPVSNYISILVGPEGGWSENEVEKFKEEKYKQMYLWERILRTETVSSVVAFYLKNR